MENERLETDEIVFAITKDRVQDFMEANYDRLLTDEEMAELPHAFDCRTDDYRFIDEAVHHLFETIFKRQLPKSETEAR